MRKKEIAEPVHLLTLHVTAQDVVTKMLANCFFMVDSALSARYQPWKQTERDDEKAQGGPQKPSPRL